MLGSLGNTPAMVGNQAVIAFIVYGRFAEPGPTALVLAAYVIAGGLVQVALSVAFHWPLALKAQREALARAFDVLADLAASGAAGAPTTGLTAGSALDDAELALTSPVLFGHADVTALLGLLEIGRRARTELVVLGARTRDLAVGLARPGAAALHGSSLAPPGPSRDFLIAVESALHVAQSVLLSTAAALRTGGEVDTGALDRAGPRVAAAAQHPSFATGPSGLAVSVADRIAALGGQLRAARGLVEDARTPGRRRTRVAVGHPPGGSDPAFVAAAETLVANLTLDSTAARHALRLSVVVMLGEWIAYHTPLQRGYWVAFTAALVLRPDFAATFTRGFARVLGTVVGVGVAGLVVVISGADHVTAVVLISILIAAGASTFQASYAVYTLFITGAIVLLLGFVTGGAWHTAGDRLVDTLIGGALALLAYALWPSWSERDARRALGRLVAAQRAYLAVVLGGAAHQWEPGGYDEGAASGLARRTRLARVNAQAAVGRSLAEPAAHRIAGGQAILATMQRIGVSAHALRTERRDRVAAGPSSALPSPDSAAAAQSLASAVDVALGAIEHALAGGAGPPGPSGAGLPGPSGAGPPDPSGAGLPPLRRLHDDLAGAVEESGGRRPVLLGETDELVDAIDTLGRLVGVPG
jgi:hypothetical protein